MANAAQGEQINKATSADIDDLVEDALENKKKLSEVVAIVEKEFKCIISNVDNCYIEEKYIETLIEFWMDEVSLAVNNLLQSLSKHDETNLGGIYELLKDLKNVNSFMDFYDLFDNLLYNNLIQGQQDTVSQLKNREVYLCNKLKRRCLIELKNFITTIQDELKFIKCFEETLLYSKDLHDVFGKLKLTEDTTFCFKELLENIQSCKSPSIYIKKLKRIAGKFPNKVSYNNISCKVEKIIESYQIPVQIKEAEVDSRCILEIRGKHIVLSEVIFNIVEKCKGSKIIEEVRFVEFGVFHIDENLTNPVWKGKNVVLCGKKVIVSSPVTWDFSGQDAEQVHCGKAVGILEDGSGMPGLDGNPGKSGGNVCILVDYIENGENLEIVSNGGKGSDGQDGAQGDSGKNGSDCGIFNFMSSFEPVCKLLDGDKLQRLKTTMESIESEIHHVEKCVIGFSELSNNPYNFSLPSIIRGIKSWKKSDLKNIYMEVKTTKGCTITFSFYYESIFISQALLLYKGAEGEEGKPGGPGGMGGSDGYPGGISISTINLNSIKVMPARSRSKGIDGNDGPAGVPGKSGSDKAYVDRTLFLNVNKTWPKYYYPPLSDDTRLAISNVDNDYAVWIPFKQHYAHITELKKIPPDLKSHKNKAKLLHNRPFTSKHSKVNRQKTICQKSILNQYKENSTEIDALNIMNNMKELLNNINEAISDVTLQSEKISTETKISRIVRFGNFLKDSPKDGVLNSEIGTNRQEPIMPSPQKMMSHNEYYLAHLNHLVSIFQSQENVSNQSVVLDPQNVSHNKALFINYNYGGISNDMSIEKYFCEDSCVSREEVVQFLKDSNNLNNLHKTVECFICEYKTLDDCAKKEWFGEQFESNDSIIKEINRQHEEFILKKNIKMQILIAPLVENLQLDKNKKILDHLLKSVLKHEEQFEFEEEISKDIFLKALYKKLMKECSNAFDWKSVLKSPEGEDFCKALYCCMKTKGPYSASFRNFVSLHLNKNVIVYGVNDKDELFFMQDHNPQKSEKVYFLLKKTRFLKLSVNDELLKVIKLHEEQGLCFSKQMINLERVFEKNILRTCFFHDSNNGFDSSAAVRVKLLHVLTQDEDILTIIKSFSSEEDQIVMKTRLEKLKLEFIGYANFLHFLALHIKFEGLCLTARELSFINNLILKFVLKESELRNLLSWILASHPQVEWLVEIALLMLELFLQHPLKQDVKVTWREMLNYQNESESLIFLIENISHQNCQNIKMAQEDIDNILVMYTRIPQAHIGLSKLNITEWKYYLKDRFWVHQVKQISDWTDDELNILSFYLETLENTVGPVFSNSLIKLLNAHKDSINTIFDKRHVLDSLKELTSRDSCVSEEMLQHLEKIKIEDWKGVIEEICLNKKTERSLETIIKIIKQSGNTSDNILNRLEDIKTNVKKCNEVLDFLRHSPSDLASLMIFLSAVFSVDTSGQSLESIITNDNLNNDVPIKFLKSLPSLGFKPTVLIPFITKEIKMCLNIVLREVQKVTIATTLDNEKSCLVQVSTGEGKSLIIVVLAIIKVFFQQVGFKVNIVTSNKNLAKRDAEKYEMVYNKFGLKVGHNCSEDLETRKKVYSECNVIYGELGNFQRDYLLDCIYEKNILGNCNFETVIVDEVDSMLLDKGNSVLYLSHDIPGLDKLEPIFIYIWQWVNLNVNESQQEEKFVVGKLKERLMQEIFGFIRKEHLRDMEIACTNVQVENTFNYLVEKEIINLKGKVLVEDICDFTNALCNLPNNCIPKHHVRYLLQKVINREKVFHIPNHLKSFVEDHIERWIKNAMKAMSMNVNSDYVVDVDRSGIGTERSPNIVIIDPDTGSDLSNSQWEEGLHQFLQLKHGCKISPVSLKSVFISNVSYLNLYETIYGFTGTLGSKIERDLIQNTYNIDYVTIPTAKPKIFEEIMPILCSSRAEWANKILVSTTQIAKKRSVLVICETVNEVLYLKKKFSANQKVSTFTRDYESLVVDKECLNPGRIIIATNLAGRGTDIGLSQELIEAGGLHVCVTFLPSNGRIEEQAYGRVARKGEPGTAQLIFCSVHEGTNIIAQTRSSVSKVIYLIKQRSVDEIKRLSEVKEFYKTQIVAEESWLNRFLEKLYEMKSCDELVNSKKEVKEILFQVCLDGWAFWLDKSGNALSLDSNDVQLSFLKFIDSCNKLWDANFISQIKIPAHLLKLGLVYLKYHEYAKAVSFFDRALEEDKYFSEFVLYYRLRAKCLEKDLKVSDIKGDLETAAIKMKERIDSLAVSASVIDGLKERNSSSILQIDSYREQKLNICHIYNMFLDSIYALIGCELSPEMFRIPLEIDKRNAIKIFSELVSKGIISPIIVKTNIDRKLLSFILNYGVTPQKMYDFLMCLKEQTFTEIQLKKKMQNALIIPCRELLWKDLLSAKALIEEEKYAFVNMLELGTLDPSLVKNISNLQQETNPLQSYNQVWLYDFTYELVCERQNQYAIFKKSELKKCMGNKRFEALKNSGVASVNKLACLQDNEQGPLDHFDSLSIEDFSNVGISQDVASDIIVELKEKGVIKLKPNTNDFSLISTKGIESLMLTKFQGYTYDVKTLLFSCFSFRIALEKGKLMLQNGENISFNLPMDVYKEIIFKLKEHNIIDMYKVNPSKSFSQSEILDLFKNLYPTRIPKSAYLKLYGEFYGMETSKKIVSILIETEVLLSSGGLKQLYSIRPETMDSLEKHKMNFKLDFKKEVETIFSVLKNYLDLANAVSKNAEFLSSILSKATGCCFVIKTPTFLEKAMIDALHDLKIPTSESSWILNSGCEYLLSIKEKNYSFSMIKNATIITCLGLGQIAFSVVVSNVGLLPIGNIFLSEGIGDLFFAVSCWFSGHCTWKSYKLNKLISMTLSMTCAFSSAVNNLSKSGVFQRFKTCLSDATVVSQTRKTELMKLTVKKIAKHTAKATALGTALATLENVIKPQLEMLGKVIINVFYTSIDEAVKNHSVKQKIQEICGKLGEQKSKKLIISSFTIIMKEKNKVEDCNSKVRDGIKSLILQTAETFLKRKCNSGGNIDSDDLFSSHLVNTVTSIVKVVNNGQAHFSRYILIVNDVLDSLEEKLKVALICPSVTAVSMKPDAAINFTHFTHGVLCELGDKLKNVFLDNLSEKVISPVLQSLANHLVTHSFKQLSRKYKNTFEMESQYTKSNTQENLFLSKENHYESLKENTMFDSDYECHLLDMFKIRRNTSIFSELIKKNALVDIDYIKSCCSVLPWILQKKGIKLPELHFVVERNGETYEFSTSNNYHSDIQTIFISFDSDISANIKKNQVLLDEFFRILHDELLKTCPELESLTADALRLLLAQTIEETEDLEHLIKGSDPDMISTFCWKDINKEAEKKSPYQNFHLDSDWKFKASVDCDIRQEKKLNCLSQYEDHITKGFKFALLKINSCIKDFLNRPFELKMSDFVGTKHSIMPETNRASGNNFRCSATHYELTVPLPVEDILEDFKITMTLKKQMTKHQRCPLGPHIKYGICSTNLKHMDKTIKGHILLNYECKSEIFEVKACHVAGELILPSKEKPLRATYTAHSVLRNIKELIKNRDISSMISKLYSRNHNQNVQKQKELPLDLD